MQQLLANNAQSTLAGPITNTSTTLTLQTGGGALFPSPNSNQFFVITMVPAATKVPGEIMWCTARSGDTLTVTRAQEGTTATAYSAGDFVSLQYTAGTFNATLQLPFYAGNPNGALPGTAGTATSAPSALWDTTDNLLWLCTTTGTATTAVWSKISGYSNVYVYAIVSGSQQVSINGAPFTTSEATSFPAVGRARVRGWGAGGGGGGSYGGGSGGTGGGAGAYFESIFGGLTSATTVTVGAHGTGGGNSSTPTAGTSGGTTSFGSLATATGGTGGSPGNGAISGVVTPGGTAAGGNALNLSGGNGGNAYVIGVGMVEGGGGGTYGLGYAPTPLSSSGATTGGSGFPPGGGGYGGILGGAGGNAADGYLIVEF